MTLDLNDHTFSINSTYWHVPDMIVMGPGTFNFAGSIVYAAADKDGPFWYTTPVIEPSVTVSGGGVIYANGGSIPNLTTTGNCTIYGGITINGDVTINHGLLFQTDSPVVEGDITVKAGDPNAGLNGGGMMRAMQLKGDLIDTNTEQNGYYTTGKVRFIGGGNLQILDVRRPSDMRLQISAGSHVVLGSDYYAPYLYYLRSPFLRGSGDRC